MQYNKRNLKRYDIFLIVEFKPLKNMADGAIGITRDLSADGFSMEAQSFDCKCGDMLEFRLKHPDTNLSVAVSGNVVWKNHSWYKYMIGVKFPEISEEQQAKIHELMSVVKEAAYEPELISTDAASIPVKEKEEVMAGKAASVKINSAIHDAAMTYREGSYLKETEYSELTGLERNFIAGDKVLEDARPAGHIEKTDNVCEDISAVRFSRVKVENAGQVRAQKIYEDNVDTAEKDRKRKIWLYVPAIMISVLALLVMIKTFHYSEESFKPALTETTVTDEIGREQSSVVTDETQALNKASDDMPDAVKVHESEARVKNTLKSVTMRDTILSAEIKNLQKDKPEINNKSTLKPEAAANTKETSGREAALNKNKVQNITPIEEKKSPGTDLIAKKEEPLRSFQSMESKKPQELKPITLPSSTAVTPAAPVTNKEISATGISQEAGKITETTQAKLTAMPEKNENILKAEPIVTTEEHFKTVPVVKAEEPLSTTSLIVTNPPKTEQAVKSEQKPTIELSAKIEKVGTKLPADGKEKGLKTGPGVKAQESPKVALFVKRDKLQANQNILKKNGSDVTNTDSSKKWKFIGTTKNGIPMFMDTANISYPAEHIVNVLINVTYNNKEFIDLVAINCSQVKLRILEARSGKNPVLSNYSNEWRDIIPDSMVLYNSVCSAKR